MTFWGKINRFLLWLALFILPWQLRHTLLFAEHQGQFFEYASISIYLSDILIILVLLTWWLAIGKPRITTGPAAIFWPLTLLIAWLWVSVDYSRFTTGNWLVGINNAAHFSLFYLFYLYLISEVRNLKTILIPLIWGCGLQAVVAIGQYAVNHSLGLKWLGESVLNPAELGIPVVMVDGVRHLRAHGALPHANVLGGYLAVVLVWGLLIYTTIQTGWRKFGYGGLLTLGLIALLFSFSRAAWLAFGIALIGWIIWRIGYQRKVSAGGWAIIAVVLVAAISQSPAVVSRFEANQIALERESLVSRVNQLSQFKSIYYKYPLIGVGIGQYTLYLEKQDISEMGWHYDSSLPGWVYNLSHQVWDYQPVHNIFLLVLAEVGWIGEILFILLLLGVLWTGGRLLRAQKSLSNFTALSSVLAIISLGLFDHYLWTLQQGRLILFLTVGMVVILYQNRGKELLSHGRSTNESFPV